ncbi:MAG TPA: ATP-binding protein [Cyanobacteria bacterium UBA11367]|nr:ATP-binding protein [Cyanobacteria bacterium UBA11367]
MSKNRDLKIQGIPEIVPEPDAGVFRSRMFKSVNDFLEKTGLENIKLVIGTASQMQNGSVSATVKSVFNTEKNGNNDESSIAERAGQYQAQPPLYDFGQLVVSDSVLDSLIAAVDAIEVEFIVFDEWGLRKIQPNPRTVLNFYGPPGTGKTLAAHAISAKLGKQILLASYADIESKFHGDGPKNLKAIFHAAERDKALLFIDEADSLLSKRLTEVNSGSEQAINSMRSELLICLEQFRGTVIFATNLVENYDKAFETRIRHIHFPMPDEKCRREIWRQHLPIKMPLSPNVLIDELAKVDNVCGREVREAVIDAANRAALKAKKQGKHPRDGIVEMKDLLDAIERKKAERITNRTSNLTPEEKEEVRQKVQTALAKKGELAVVEHTNEVSD